MPLISYSSIARLSLPLAARLVAAGERIDVTDAHDEQPAHDRERQQSDGLVHEGHDAASVFKVVRRRPARRSMVTIQTPPITTSNHAPTRSTIGPVPLML